ncbi:MAG TPA: co-chaperone DjlA, partial [Salinisphaeraceae bacterium]|nr:co-chaperone DjlA [Salinisphaeraceae bacterium]
MLIGAIIGAVLGFLTLGWPGLLLGIVLGVWAAQMLVFGLRKGRLGEIRAQYLTATFAVMGAVCKADGQVSANEIAVAEQMFQRLRLDDEQRAQAQAAFRRGKQTDFDLDAEVAKVAQLCRGQRALVQMFLQVQVAAIAADGAVHRAEHELLLRVARGLGLAEADLRQIEAMLGFGQDQRQRQGSDALGGQAAGEAGLEQAYAVLEVSPAASDAEVK